MTKKKLTINDAKKIVKNTTNQMKSLGIYKPEYDRIIKIYSQLCEQYDNLTLEFTNSNYNCTSYTAAGGEKKDPLVATLETLRKDILVYSDRLCLNPKSFDAMNIKPAPKISKLDAAMDAIQNE